METYMEKTEMKKKICDLKPGTPFKHEGQVFIIDVLKIAIRLTDGEIFGDNNPIFENESRTLVTVCKRIRKSDVKERKR